MPTIYLSPSTQEFNIYSGGGSEEYYMNLLADAMEPYLAASGIQFVRNTPEMTAASSIAASNSGNYDFHLALHSNASGSGNGNVRGAEFYYYPTSSGGKRFADILDVWLFQYDGPIMLENATTAEVAQAEWMTKEQIKALQNEGKLVHLLDYFFTMEDL
jgi:N-acetylmuramoyl-L-alanine amidase